MGHLGEAWRREGGKASERGGKVFKAYIFPLLFPLFILGGLTLSVDVGVVVFHLNINS